MTSASTGAGTDGVDRTRVPGEAGDAARDPRLHRSAGDRGRDPGCGAAPDRAGHERGGDERGRAQRQRRGARRSGSTATRACGSLWRTTACSAPSRSAPTTVDGGLKVLLVLADEVTVRAGRRGERGTIVRFHVRSRSPVSAAPGRVQLLVVDADRFSGRSLSSLLTAEGYEVALAASVSAGRGGPDGPARPRDRRCDDLERVGRRAVSRRSRGRGFRSWRRRSSRRPRRCGRTGSCASRSHPLEVLTVVRQLLAPDVASDPVRA